MFAVFVDYLGDIKLDMTIFSSQSGLRISGLVIAVFTDTQQPTNAVDTKTTNGYLLSGKVDNQVFWD